MQISRFTMRLSAVIILITALALFIGWGLPQPDDFTDNFINGIPIAPQLDAYAPDFDNPTLDGENFHLANLQGETIVINFWATWCVPCAVEMPELQALHEDTGIRIIGINIGEDEAAIQTWVERFELTFDIVLDRTQQLAQTYQLRGYPSTYVINPDGIITHIFYGAVNQAALQRAIRTHTEAAS